MERPSIELLVTEVLDKRLSELLLKVSEKLNEPREKLLTRLTTFRDREGNEVLGKDSIEDLTESQKSYVLKRLNSILRGEDHSCLVS
jgi:hypothetical protein